MGPHDEDLQSEKKQECFHTIESSINEIAEEQVVGVGALSTNLRHDERRIPNAIP